MSKISFTPPLAAEAPRLIVSLNISLKILKGVKSVAMLSFALKENLRVETQMKMTIKAATAIVIKSILFLMASGFFCTSSILSINDMLFLVF